MGFIKDWQQGVIEHLEFYLAAVKSCSLGILFPVLYKYLYDNGKPMQVQRSVLIVWQKKGKT